MEAGDIGQEGLVLDPEACLVFGCSSEEVHVFGTSFTDGLEGVLGHDPSVAYRSEESVTREAGFLDELFLRLEDFGLRERFEGRDIRHTGQLHEAPCHP